MNMRRWELLEFLTGYDGVTAWEVAEAFQIGIYCSRVRLKRAFNFGWVLRQKYKGIYYYSLSQKAWDFWAQCGQSFINNNPYYGYSGTGKKKPDAAVQGLPGSV